MNARGFFAAFLLCISTSVFASSFDAYIAPMATFSVPVFDGENPFASQILDPKTRIGFKVESGLLSDHLSVDIRFASGSYYEDFGFMFRFFDCIGYDLMTMLCYGAGLGATYSPGFITEAKGRTFVDTLVSPYLRFVFDTKSEVGVVAEIGVDFIMARSYSTETPRGEDRRVKYRPFLGAGLLFDWEKVDDPLKFRLSAVDGSLGDGYSTVSFGVKGGLGLTKFVLGTSGSNPTSSVGEFRNGVLGGLSLDIGQYRWGFQTDALYASRRVGSSSTVTGTFDRFEVFPMVRFKNVSANYFLLTGGGFLAMPIGKGTVTTYDGSGGSTTASGIYQPFDFGLSAGFGAGTRSKLVAISFEARFSWGFANWVQNSTTSYQRSRFFDFLIGFLF